MGLDQYAYINAETITSYNAKTKTTQTRNDAEKEFYWRKHARLQKFMEDLFVEKTQKSATELNCNQLWLTEEDILRLAKQVESGYETCQSEGGFFYGHQFQDESVKEYNEQDNAFIKEALEALKKGKGIMYSCWW